MFRKIIVSSGLLFYSFLLSMEQKESSGLLSRVKKQQQDLSLAVRNLPNIDSEASILLFRMAASAHFATSRLSSSVEERANALQFVGKSFPREKKCTGWQDLYIKILKKASPLDIGEKKELITQFSQSEVQRSEFIDHHVGLYIMLPGLYAYVYRQTKKSHENVKALYQRTMSQVDEEREHIIKQVSAYREFYRALSSDFEPSKTALVLSTNNQLDALRAPVRVQIALEEIAQATRGQSTFFPIGIMSIPDETLRDDTIGLISALAGKYWQEKKWGEKALTILRMLQVQGSFNQSQKALLHKWAQRQIDYNDMEFGALQSLNLGLLSLCLYARSEKVDEKMIDLYVKAQKEVITVTKSVSNYMEQTAQIVEFVELLP